MRFYVASAALIVAAAIPFASNGGDGECNGCTTAAPVMASAAPVVQDSETPVAAQSQPEVASEAAAQPDVCATLIDAAHANDLPPAFLARLIWQESRFDSSSISSAGAMGIAQFMPQTASEIGLSDPHDPTQALPASARFLKRLRGEFGNLGLAAAAYNAGSGRIRDWLANRQSLPDETKHYVRIITGHSAKDWTDDQSVLAVPTVLPRGTPCPEIEANAETSTVPVRVALTTEIAGLIQRTKEEAEAAAARARRLAKMHRTRRGKDTVIASHHGRKTLASRGSKRARFATA